MLANLERNPVDILRVSLQDAPLLTTVRLCSAWHRRNTVVKQFFVEMLLGAADLILSVIVWVASIPPLKDRLILGALQDGEPNLRQNPQNSTRIATLVADGSDVVLCAACRSGV
jgi:hypothetical protein